MTVLPKAALKSSESRRRVCEKYASKKRDLLREERRKISDLREWMVVERFEKTRYDDEEIKIIPEWADLPEEYGSVSGRKRQIHFASGRGYDGVMRTETKAGSFVWTYANGYLISEDSKPTSRRMNVNNKTVDASRLVAFGFLQKPEESSGRDIVCHIISRKPGEEPNNDANNLYFGTYKDNADDDTRAGRPKKSLRRPFLGRKRGETDWMRFETQEEAAECIDVDRATISYALKHGWLTGKDKWELKWEEMDLLGVDIARISDEEGENRFVTSDGRYGEFMKIGDSTCPVEIYLETNPYGYVNNVRVSGKSVVFHRLVFERFKKEEIEEKMRITGLDWSELQVDHINGIKTDNRVENLRVVTQQEHNDKHAMAVLEVDEEGIPIKGCRWKSYGEAGRYALPDTVISAGNVRQVCLGYINTVKGKRFKLEIDCV
jgi:hypothetical protein